jgi:exonuclease SbcC
VRFDRIRLESFKCYADADLVLEPGVTVIHGPNGSGKSSLLEACFFALYGHRALDKTLDDVVTIGAEEAHIELWFSHAGRDYHVEREIRVRGDSAQTTTCVLEGPGETVDGATDVRVRVTELLRMDSEAFVNCAYVRQGEVNKLINASPSDRQDMIDDLLQLGKLEEYRERAKNARLGVKHVRDAREAVLEDAERKIAEREDADPYERLNRLESTLNEVTSKVEEFEAKREPAEETRQNAESVLEEYREAQADIEELEVEIAELESAIQEREAEREAKADRISEHRETMDELRKERREVLAETELNSPDPEATEARREELEERLEDIRESVQERLLEKQEHANETESADERAAESEEAAATKREEADEREAELEHDREQLADRREKLSELEAAVEADREAFADAPVGREKVEAHREAVAESLTEAREHVAELEATLEARREAVAEAERLREEGKCPECGQPVEDSPHVETLADDRAEIESLETDLGAAREAVAEREAELETIETLVERASKLDQRESNLENLRTLVDQQSENFEEREAAVERLREEADELDSEAEAARETAGEARERVAEVKSAIGELNTEKSAVDAARERLDRVADLNDDIEDHEDAVDRLREQRANLAEGNDLRREQLADKRAEKRDLADEFDEEQVEHARTEKERAEQYLEKIDARLEELHERENDLRGTIGGVRNAIEELESLREERAELRATVDRLQSLYDEAYELQEMYRDLRAELRQRNVRRLERLLNETFELLYRNDSYARIKLDGEYDLTVLQKDGEPLEPEQLSGGERAIFNLALRCAIYRLLAEGIEGETPMPPLILDEPTVFLDTGHVSKLVELVEAMRGYGVEQILVVSHDEELVGAADDLVTVEKDTTSNRSSVGHDGGAVDAAVLAEMEGDD